MCSPRLFFVGLLIRTFQTLLILSILLGCDTSLDAAGPGMDGAVTLADIRMAPHRAAMRPSTSSGELDHIRLPNAGNVTVKLHPTKRMPPGGLIPAWGGGNDDNMTRPPPNTSPPLRGSSRMGTRASTPASSSRPYTPGELPSLAAHVLSNSPYSEEQKLRKEVQSLRKRNKELEREMRELRDPNPKNRPLDPVVRQRQINTAYGVHQSEAAVQESESVEMGTVTEPLQVAPGIDQTSQVDLARKEWEAQAEAERSAHEQRVSQLEYDKSQLKYELESMRTQLGSLTGDRCLLPLAL